MMLGAIFAGGRSRRFGSDKALAAIGDKALLDRVVGRLRPQVDQLVIVGRDWPGLPRIEDAPAPGLGPLGALCGALGHAADHGFALVLTSGCDLPDIPADLPTLLGTAPAVVQGQPLLGLWPAALAPALAEYLAHNPDRSMRGWIDAAGARRVSAPGAIANINTPADLADYLNSSADPRSSP